MKTNEEREQRKQDKLEVHKTEHDHDSKFPYRKEEPEGRSPAEPEGWRVKAKLGFQKRSQSKD